uniref:Uncharacterized protein n=1 Tax=Arundo donax TaxID=35708 RepID=A0A0A8YET4_ARUDO
MVGNNNCETRIAHWIVVLG